jgi:hypothetical protein
MKLISVLPDWRQQIKSTAKPNRAAIAAPHRLFVNAMPLRQRAAYSAQMSSSAQADDSANTGAISPTVSLMDSPTAFDKPRHTY